MPKRRLILGLTLSIAIAQAAGLLGSVVTFTGDGSWYMALNLPSWNPPGWIFGPVWTTLYTLMGISAFLVWKEPKTKERHTALWLYGIHLILNTLWSIIFFGLQNPAFAFFEILVLWSFIILLVQRFWKLNKTASLLLTPYLAWVSFAAVLNLTIWQLN